MIAAARQSERGAALITVLMIIAAMSVVAIGISQTVTSATQRARSLQAQAQIRMYSIAAEEVAEIQIAQLLSGLSNQLVADLPGLEEAQTFPIEGGLITVRAADATNCFNLNSLVGRAESAERTVMPGPLQDYLTLLQTTGIDASDASALASAVIDWMDEDSSAGLGGAEDGYYLDEEPAYRTSSRPLANLSELRAIRGYTQEVIYALQPVLCALPAEGALPVEMAMNLNTLKEAQAPLLSAAFSGQLSLTDARAVIAARPLGGWPDVETLLAEPAIAVIAPDQRKLHRLGIVSGLVEVYAEVAYRDQVMNLQYLFDARPGHPVQAIRRRRVG